MTEQLFKILDKVVVVFQDISYLFLLYTHFQHHLSLQIYLPKMCFFKFSSPFATVCVTDKPPFLLTSSCVCLFAASNLEKLARSQLILRFVIRCRFIDKIFDHECNLLLLVFVLITLIISPRYRKTK